MNLTGRPIYQKEGKPKKDRKHLERVKMLPCVVCNAPPPSDAHHCIHDRYSQRKRGDDWAIPLCKQCHQHGPDAIHNDPKGWKEKYGNDYDFLPIVRQQLEDGGYHDRQDRHHCPRNLPRAMRPLR